MSAGVVTLQAQVESVLGALVKAATAELTKLFESRYRASVLDVDVGRTEHKKGTEPLENLDSLWTGGSKRSIGVQVDGDICPPLERCGSPLFSDVDCLREGSEEVVEGLLIPAEILLAEDNGDIDLEWSPLKEQIVTDPGDLMLLNGIDPECAADSDSQAEVVLHVSAETWMDMLTPESVQNSPTKQKPIVIRPDTRDSISGENVKFVCPLILKPESPAHRPDFPEKPVQAEPQPACVSTAKGTAYSPSPSDGAVTPLQAGVWERIHTPKETKDDLHIKLKLTSVDQKLLRPCAVQLVNMLKMPESETKLQDIVAKSQKTGWPLPKDLRHHQGLHTGHRLCCFTPCGDDVWQLKKVVVHSSDGYACSVCGKMFKRRKILRRHERFHTGEKPYPCSACSKRFALRKSLRRHMRFHTGERPHTCTQCSKSFRLRDNLKAHLRFHTGEKPFSCTSCGKTFRIMKNLENHQCDVFAPSFRMIAGLKV